MPEVILPCPAWACQGELVESKQDGENFFIECTECGMRGPVEPDPYHAQQSWDWLPRALTWTHEPPQVAGKYWWRDKRRPDESGITNVTETTLDGYRRNPIGEYEQFAGPIPQPIG